jgi:hypothetical protein
VRCSFGDGSGHDDMVRVLHPLAFTRPGRTPLRTFARKLLFMPHARLVEQASFRFCFVRHPVRWYESYWSYQWGGAGGHGAWKSWGDRNDPIYQSHPTTVLNGTKDADFNGFVRKVIAKRPGFVTELYGLYTQAGIGFIGKQENLVEDLIRVLRVLNVKYDEDQIRNRPPTNVSPRPKSPIVWDDELRREVERLEYAALIRYGYLPNCKDEAHLANCKDEAGGAIVRP